MFALLDAMEDGKPVTLCFVDKHNAQQFKKFAITYMEEGGAGNGYSAYWVRFDAQIIQADVIPPHCVTRLNGDLISAMCNSIITARMAGDRQSEKGGIVFWGRELPPRQRPTCGDMFRSLVSQGAAENMEGRVVADHGYTLEVINWQDEGEDGKPKPGARVVTILAAQTMKIHDRRSRKKM